MWVVTKGVYGEYWVDEEPSDLKNILILACVGTMKKGYISLYNILLINLY